MSKASKIETYSKLWSVYVLLPNADCGFEVPTWRDTAIGAERSIRSLYPSATIVVAS
jgi:hypothetical protein